MTGILTFVAVVSLIAGVISGIASSRRDGAEGQAYARISLLCFVLFFFVCGIWVVSAGQSAAEDQAKQALALEYDVQPGEIVLKDIICEATSYNSCISWSANYKVGGKTGWIKFSTQSSQIKPDGK